ncbi:MAG: F0F1 ATP synthase subunit delta [Gammaproteobacteria bacterium]|nr:F0F1 ATP synthase subunit delta [Gammaproteobacteria bacterium]MDH5215319.1 F0F1 ATP synthase subunit delta [Gammaproteobacteria bacterium]MDH5500796.1 F0F1 ATP synthase subunit delta [Gammaproteobacteria bacterium]
MADKNTIARPYAQAAFDLAREGKSLDSWADALSLAGSLLADGKVAKFLSTPKLTDAKRLEFLTGLISSAGGSTSILGGSNKQGSNFLKLLLEYDRIAVLPEIAAHFAALKAKVENTVDVTVTSATPLSATQQQAIVKALKERLGSDVNLSTQVNEKLIGGAVIRAGDVVIDGSLRSRLESLTNALIA